MCDATFDYTYEYQGNASKLVHTPLTDKCYLVLTQGMHLGYGGNPYGPAGTGKTESVKALGNALGRQVLVFNCDEGIDFKSMGRIFTGLVKSGAWGCFDEFNRLKEDQLSAVSQQIQVIQAAIKTRTKSCELMNREINVNFNAGIFVTMNPASKEYGGRSKLPHNLKQLFRSVAMSKPDLGLISEVILYAEGFQYAKEIAAKVVYMYDLSKQLLTVQRHYDWGLRAIKPVLTQAGALVRKAKRLAKEKNSTVSKEYEMVLLIGAVKMNTLSKLTYDDSIRYKKLLKDVFPGINDEKVEYAVLEEAIKKAIIEMKLEIQEGQIEKILQLHQSLEQRMGCVVVGPSGSSKTTILNILHRAKAILGQKIIRHVMNPKAIEREKLLGYMDHDTREWYDGVLTAAARQVMTEDLNSHSWIICDGDVDPEWIESLNSVLDDNHLLTMPNGERIKFGNNVNFIFETHDLQHASPATVSRMGMIFLSEKDIDLKPLVRKWIANELLNKNGISETILTSWMESYFYKALDYCLNIHDNPEQNKNMIQSTKVGIVNTALSQLKDIRCKEDFAICLIRGMGSILPIKERKNFALNVYLWCNIKAPDNKAPLDAVYNRERKVLMQYQHIDTKIKSENISHHSPPLIETVDIQRNQAILRLWINYMEPILIVGPEGAGKNLLITNTLNEDKKLPIATIHCNAQTKPLHVISKLADICAILTTAKGRTYRPKGSAKKAVLYLKDINLPSPDEYDTIQLIAFLQQLITYHGFYDDNLEFVHVENIQIIASMCPATSIGRNKLSTRFTAIVNILYIDYPTDDQLNLVYTSLFKTVLKLSNKYVSKITENVWKSFENVKKLCKSTLLLYNKFKTAFKVEEYRHYLFNPRDITKWIFGLLRYNFSQVKLLDAYYYEAIHLFKDRLIDIESMRKFDKIFTQIMRNEWQYDIPNIYFTTLNMIEYTDDDTIHQSATIDDDNDDNNNISTLQHIGRFLYPVALKSYTLAIKDSLYAYEREFKDLNMLLFPEIIDHIASAERILTKPGGNMLLIGDSGVGRRTSTTLACFMLRIQMKTINLSQKYNQDTFANDMKEILKIAGVDGKAICLYLEDHQFLISSFLEDINGLLSSGDISGLFTLQDKDQLLQPLKEKYHQSGYTGTLWDYYLSRVKNNLHIVLSMNYKHPLYALRTESNPAIFNACEINWMGTWSKYGMKYVPEKLLINTFKLQKIENNDEKIQQFISKIQFIHDSCINLGATPINM